MNRPFLTFSTIIFVVVLLFAGYYNLSYFVKSDPQSLGDVLIDEDNSGIRIDAPKENDVVSSPLKISGSVNGNGWTGFEAQVGTVKLQDSNGKELALGLLMATAEEWMQLPTYFETTLVFDIGKAKSGRLVLHNENASGDPERDKVFIMPIKFK